MSEMEAVDISAPIWWAFEARSSWSRELASVVTWAKAEAVGLDLRWDPGAGERWIVLSNGDEVVAMVNTVIPFAVVSEQLPGVLPYPLHTVTLSAGWHDPGLAFRDRKSEAIPRIQGLETLLEEKSSAFSAHDLWFFTLF